MRTLPAGSVHPTRNVTTEQLAQMDAINDDRFSLRLAKAEYVNKFLLPDGTLTDDASIIDGVLQDASTAAQANGTRQDMLAAAEVLRLREEIAEHMTQNRFLFIPIYGGAQMIYYQCSVPTNPDLPPLAEA